MTKHSPTSKIRDVIAPPKSSPNGPSYTTHGYNQDKSNSSRSFSNCKIALLCILLPYLTNSWFLIITLPTRDGVSVIKPEIALKAEKL